MDVLESLCDDLLVVRDEDAPAHVRLATVARVHRATVALVLLLVSLWATALVVWTRNP